MCLNHPWILKFQDKNNSSHITTTTSEAIILDNNNLKDQQQQQLSNNKHNDECPVPHSPNNNSTAAPPLFQPRSEASIQDDCELEIPHTNELAVCDVVSPPSQDVNANGDIVELRAETNSKDQLHEDGVRRSPMPSPLGSRRALSHNKENLPKEVQEAKRFCMQMSPQHRGEVVC